MSCWNEHTAVMPASCILEPGLHAYIGPVVYQKFSKRKTEQKACAPGCPIWRSGSCVRRQPRPLQSSWRW